MTCIHNTNVWCNVELPDAPWITILKSLINYNGGFFVLHPESNWHPIKGLHEICNMGSPRESADDHAQWMDCSLKSSRFAKLEKGELK